jgi:hypothetical protein
MSGRLPKIDRDGLRTTSIHDRKSRVKIADAAVPHRAGASFEEFLGGLPATLAAEDLRAAIAATARARAQGRTLLWGFGAHVIKVGLGPVLIDLLERGMVSGMFTNGASCVHDLELALIGRTSEDVSEEIDTGSFGMARETASELNRAIVRGAEAGIGMGEAIGREILDGDYPHKDRSLFANAVRLGIPITVHVAIGGDIHHMHPGADGAALGATSYRDFETLASLVATLRDGVVYNIGSAVILPEVFLKALSLARNLGHPAHGFTAVDMDFIRQYRPQVNVVERPTRRGGRGISLIGPHEILLPLLAAGLVEATREGDV